MESSTTGHAGACLLALLRAGERQFLLRISAGSHVGVWTMHAAACRRGGSSTQTTLLRGVLSCSCVRMRRSGVGFTQEHDRGFKNLVLGFVISRSCINLYAIAWLPGVKLKNFEFPAPDIQTHEMN